MTFNDFCSTECTNSVLRETAASSVIEQFCNRFALKEQEEFSLVH